VSLIIAGYSGRILMVCKEKFLPYDRPKLSKAMTVTADRILLRSQQFFDQHNIEVRCSLFVLHS
jgi:NAD(P)H-nitrite reductase large subunit